MHEIEPYYNWRDHYRAEADERSPFYGKEYDEFTFSTSIYNYFIHPQWDGFGSPTLYTKILFSDYDRNFVIMEFIGEWNDCTQNDIMFLKRDLIDSLMAEGIYKFVLIGENILNLHAGDDDYYEEWYEDIIEEGGWVMAINMREHVIDEMDKSGLNRYIHYGRQYNDIPWRKFKPAQLVTLLEAQLMKILN
ncbi:MAG: hypothetical protein GY751_04455 [Bacteroidetes bacterium]|nr:hypothetical protein [Bacteroidota bacterium]